ncbi:hypothetical protein NT695_002432 [Vibrio fluvialis]|nr:hypothetical protein [Vibrio fluvialis]
MDKFDPNLEAYRTAITTRNFEIELYWKRSLFFWGFIATAALGYGSAIFNDNPNQNLAMLIASFGLVCSLCWSLVNRGSKYWQEHWEKKVTDFEAKLARDMLVFRAEDARDTSKSCWLGSRKYSVSRIAIALSDYTVLVWLFLITNRLISFIPEHIYLSVEAKATIAILTTLIYCTIILIFCKSNPWIPTKSKHNK